MVLGGWKEDKQDEVCPYVLQEAANMHGSSWQGKAKAREAGNECITTCLTPTLQDTTAECSRCKIST